MSCNQFKNKGYLYLSNELSHTEASDFKHHLAECKVCREAFKEVKRLFMQLNDLPLEKPNPDIRNRILNQAGRNPVNQNVWAHMKLWFKERDLHRRHISWAISIATLAVFFLLVAIHYTDHYRIDNTMPAALMDWQDDFLAEADWIEQEIDRVDSGDFLMSGFTIKMTESDEEGLSTLSKEIDGLQVEIEDLISTIDSI